MHFPLADLRIDMQFARAKFVLGLMQSWDVPTVAEHALSNGLYAAALADLADLRQPTREDVAKLLDEALADLGLNELSKPEAAWFIAWRCAEEIAGDSQSPLAALELLRDASRAVADILPDHECVGDNLDVAPLISTYYVYSEPSWNCVDGCIISDENARRVFLDSLARKDAKEWLMRHSDRRLSWESTRS